MQQIQLEKYRSNAGGVSGKNYWQRDIALATVDCTQDVNSQLCQREHIQAFPTVRIFREGTDRKNGLHETYHGDRSAEEIANFATKVLTEVQNKQAALPSGHGLDQDGDGDVDLALAGIEDNALSVLINTGDGMSYERFELVMSEDPGLIETGDLDGDGTIDLLVAGFGESGLAVRLGDGQGVS